MTETAKALSGVRIVDFSDERAVYGVKLLADLGADVIRPVSDEGDPLATRGPFDQQTGQSLWYAYHTSSRRVLHVSPDPQQPNLLNDLCAHADVVVVNDRHPFESELDLAQVRQRSPSTVIVECTSFGKTGPWANFLAPDLVAGAMGGSVGITGDAETPPLKPFGDLNFAVSGAYVAIACLAGLYCARNSEEGQFVRVSAHECIASCLEHVFMWYLYNDSFPRAQRRALERRGSLHWTDLYHVMAAQDGNIMVTPTPSLDNQLVWLIEEDAHDDLLDPEYQEPQARGKWARRMMDVLRNWVATKDVESLFFEAQEHHAPYGWVHSIPQVADNPQLAARDWWESVKVGGNTVTTTGVPYQHHDTPAAPRDTEEIVFDSEDVINAIGWGDEE